MHIHPCYISGDERTDAVLYAAWGGIEKKPAMSLLTAGAWSYVLSAVSFRREVPLHKNRVVYIWCGIVHPVNGSERKMASKLMKEISCVWDILSTLIYVDRWKYRSTYLQNLMKNVAFKQWVILVRKIEFTLSGKYHECSHRQGGCHAYWRLQDRFPAVAELHRFILWTQWRWWRTGTRDTEVGLDGWCEGGLRQQRNDCRGCRQCAKDWKEWRAPVQM